MAPVALLFIYALFSSTVLLSVIPQGSSESKNQLLKPKYYKAKCLNLAIYLAVCNHLESKVME